MIRWAIWGTLLLGAAEPVSAQRLLAHDTLTMDGNSAITCGFCFGERYGVVFRELPDPARALNAEDFPLQLQAIRVAVAAARVVGGGLGAVCEGVASGGTQSAGIEVYAGSELPTEIVDNPVRGAWPGETVVWQTEQASLDLSVAQSDGGNTYDATFNELRLADETRLPVRVPAGFRYLRVVVTFGEDATSSDSCLGLGSTGANFYPMRDDDGRIADQRGFLYAEGRGWLWNEEAGVDGDWALRLLIRPASAMVDAGPLTTRTDAGPPDASVDAGGEGAAGGGCSAYGTSTLSPAILVWIALRRRRD